ncbi:hypothetical protein BT96DRAFT_1004993 [Gymnopus androsaceus JB14]|uniref:Uncharacterized protein n=1 Tax=Gymnopus androsaceus JB14 TaxID=1447944 RepID=A0A6A4GPP0_9AGAR|nr:hypothetical protein BT96DRAFT_1004993 [Gymnopus androsaceus JB14]
MAFGRREWSGKTTLLSLITGDHPQSDLTLSFGHRQQAGGAFYDYSARYGAVHEEDRLTLRQSMFPETLPPLLMPYEDTN